MIKLTNLDIHLHIYFGHASMLKSCDRIIMFTHVHSLLIHPVRI